jgi:leader peptidase (prepilin peptidase)/N-methyltransferase
LVGLGVGAGLRMLVQHSTLLPTPLPRLSPPVVLEVITAMSFLALAWRIGAAPELFAYSWFAAVNVPLAAIDWRTRELPTKLIWPSVVVLAALFGLAAAVNHDLNPLIRSGAGMLVLLAFYGAIYFLRPGQLGGGDVRLGGLLGLALGWFSWPALLVGTLLGWLGAAIGVLVVRRVRGPDASHDMPLGPFLIAGTFLIVLLDSSL